MSSGVICEYQSFRSCSLQTYMFLTALSNIFLSAALVELNHQKTRIDYFCWKFASVICGSMVLAWWLGFMGRDFGVVNVTTPLLMD